MEQSFEDRSSAKAGEREEQQVKENKLKGKEITFIEYG